MLPDTTVTVVAPATNQSGTGGKTTTGTQPTVTDAHTASGYPAKAVAGYPADTIVWAIDRHGVAAGPDVVLSGVNFGQNIGSAVDVSGTVGAARAAAQRGIPALAVSAGIAKNPAYALAARQAVAWLTKHRAGLRAAKATVTNLNVPTCASGAPRRLVRVPVAGNEENPLAEVACAGPAPKPTTDVNGFVHPYIVETDNLSLQPPAS
jgi:5'-nucleotidase